MNKAGLELLKRFEGFRDEAYLDPVGVPTIGYGFTKGVKLGDTMPRSVAEARLKEEIAAFARGVDRLVIAPANENQRSAMISLAYNIGLGAFSRSTVLRKHNERQFEDAARAFNMWVKAGGKVLKGLVRRRAAEAALYLAPMNEQAEAVEIEETKLNQRPVSAGKTAAESTTVRAAAAQGVIAVGAAAAAAESISPWLALAAGVAAGVLATYIILERMRHAQEDGV